MADQLPNGLGDFTVGLVKHLGLDKAGDLTRSLGFGEYFRKPPDNESDREKWLEDRYARDLYGHLVLDDVAAFFLRQLSNAHEAQDYALNLVEDADLLSIVSQASSVMDVLALLGLRVRFEREITYGVEDCIRRVRERVNALPYVEMYGEDVLPDLFRGRAVGLWSEVEMLLKHLFVFYREYFSERDDTVRDVFSFAMTENSLGQRLRAIDDIERCFREGETEGSLRARRQALNTRIEEIQARVSQMERQHNRLRRDILRRIRDHDEKIRSVQEEMEELSRKERSVPDEQSKPAIEDKLKQIKLKREALEHLRANEYKQEDKIVQDEETERKKARSEIDELRYGFDKQTEERRVIASKLQSRCRQLLGRESPFARMDLDRIERLVDPYRNLPAHAVRELLMKQGAIQKAQAAGEEILAVLSEWVEQGLVPRTAYLLCRLQDMYGRPFLVFGVDDPNDKPEPLWSLKRLILVYEWKERPYNENEVYLMAASPGQMVFEPIILSWSDIRPALMSLSASDNPSKETP